MSIFPATDLVSEVARAANPQKLNAAVTRLSELSSARIRSKEDFANLIDGVGDASMSAARGSATPDVVAVAPGRTAALSSAKSGQNARASDATEKFEAYIIQTCLETILPRSEQGVFGQGTAGGVWRSMIAEQLGNQIAKAGGVGLHKMLDQHWAHRDEGADAASAPPQSPT